MISFLLAATSTKASSGGSAVFQLVFFGAIFAGMYFLLLRPQRKRMRETQALQSSINVDDEVVPAAAWSEASSALDDIRESLEELRYYRSTLFVPTPVV